MALSRNPDIPNFVHNACVVDESKYPRKVMDAKANKTQGKRNAADIVDLESDDNVKVEVNDEVASPSQVQPLIKKNLTEAMTWNAWSRLGRRL